MNLYKIKTNKDDIMLFERENKIRAQYLTIDEINLLVLLRKSLTN